MLMSEHATVKYILYADDDEDDQEIMKDLIPQIIPEMELIIKENGLDVLDFLNELPKETNLPDLIILDLNMPFWDGIQTLKKIRKYEHYRHVPVLIFSTTSNEIDRHRALLAGAVGFVSKPSSYRELQSIIKSFTFYFNS